MHIAFMLKGRRKTVDRSKVGADNFREVSIIQRRLKTDVGMQKSYEDPKRKDVSFSAGDLMLLKRFPMKGVMRFGKKGKLAPRYIEPFEIRSRVGEVLYRLVLPLELSRKFIQFYT